MSTLLHMMRIPGALLFTLCLAVLLNGCSSQSSPPETPPAPPPSEEPPPPPLFLAPPLALTQARAIDRDALRPLVTLSGGTTVGMTRDSSTGWSGSVDLLPNSSHQLRIVWLEKIGDREIDLALYDQPISVGESAQTINIVVDDYDLTLDFDGDGMTNLQERENNTDPFTHNAVTDPALNQFGIGTNNSPSNSGNPPTSNLQRLAHVTVPRIARSAAPQIDGLGAAVNGQGQLIGEWANAVQFDRNGQPLTINNLMIDVSAEGEDGAPYRRWAAMHDGQMLYLLVLVDDVGRRHSDSDLLWEDDSVELFIDGNNSKLPRWGDADDFHFLIPLLQQNTSASNNSVQGRVGRGPGSSPAPLGLRFATGPGIGPDGVRRARWEQDVYEIQISLNSAGIVPGLTFGLELQVNDDDNGGSRDSKWGWRHPSRNTTDTDLTYLNPSVMGIAVLE